MASRVGVETGRCRRGDVAHMVLVVDVRRLTSLRKVDIRL